jgi:hypothetical protein
LVQLRLNRDPNWYFAPNFDPGDWRSTICKLPFTPELSQLLVAMKDVSEAFETLVADREEDIARETAAAATAAAAPEEVPANAMDVDSRELEATTEGPSGDKGKARDADATLETDREPEPAPLAGAADLELIVDPPVSPFLCLFDNVSLIISFK